MTNIYEPIFRGFVPFQIMDEVEPDFCRAHGLVPDSGKCGVSSGIRFFWLTKTMILAIEFPRSQWMYEAVNRVPAVRCVLRINKFGHLDNLGVEGLMEPEAQDALKSWTVLAKMAPKKDAVKT